MLGTAKITRLGLSALAIASACLAPLTWSEEADARLEHVLSYSKNQSFNSALRYLRVDHGYTVTEKDVDSGYLLFEYPTRDKGLTQGSIEVVERKNEVALIVQLPKMPSYHEQMLVEGLLKKLRDDYGSPSAARPTPPPKDEEKPDDDKSQDESKDRDVTAPQQPSAPNKP